MLFGSGTGLGVEAVVRISDLGSWSDTEVLFAIEFGLDAEADTVVQGRVGSQILVGGRGFLLEK